MYSLLWLLLPVAAASGWYAAYKTMQPKPVKRALTADYFQGLNYLINDQPDKAIEVLSRMIESDNETVDTHITLGSLFRRRGEADRAIRLHQAVVNKLGVGDDHRAHAMLELSHDYVRAGLLDRAEALLQELVDHPLRGEAALRLLLSVLQIEKEWEKAIEVAHKLQERSGDNLQPIIAHYHCELAEQAHARHDTPRRSRHLEQALEADSRCVRASLLESRAAADAGELTDAIRALQRVANQDAAFISETLEPLTHLYFRTGQRAELVNYLEEVLRTYADVSAALKLSQVMEEQRGSHDAGLYIASLLTKIPSLRALHRLVDLTLRDDASAEVKDPLRVINGVLESYLEKQALYRCQHCGFRGRALHWLCPGCKNWNTVKPLLGTAGEVNGVPVI